MRIAEGVKPLRILIDEIRRINNLTFDYTPITYEKPDPLTYFMLPLEERKKANKKYKVYLHKRGEVNK